MKTFIGSAATLCASSILSVAAPVGIATADTAHTRCLDSYGNETSECDVFPVPDAPSSTWPEWLPGSGGDDHCSVDCGDPTNPNSPFWHPGLG